MLEYEKIDVSEGIDVNKSSDKSKNVNYVIFGTFWIKIFIIKSIIATVVTICQ